MALISVCPLVPYLRDRHTFLFYDSAAFLRDWRWSSYQYWFSNTLCWQMAMWVLSSVNDTRPKQWDRLQRHVWLSRALFSALVESQTSLQESLCWGLTWVESLNVGQHPLLSAAGFLPQSFPFLLFPSNCLANLTKLLIILTFSFTIVDLQYDAYKAKVLVLLPKWDYLWTIEWLSDGAHTLYL